MWRSGKKYNLIWQRGFYLTDYLRDLLTEAADPELVKTFREMTYRQSKVFRAVVYMTEENPAGITLKALAKKLQISAPATSEMVDVLEQKGILERSRSTLDRRAICIKVSARMIEELIKMDEFYANKTRKLLAVLNEKEVNELLFIFDKLYREVQDLEASKEE